MSKMPPADDVPDGTTGALPPVPELPEAYAVPAAPELPPVPDFGPSPDDAPAPFRAAVPPPVPPSLPPVLSGDASAAPGTPAAAPLPPTPPAAPVTATPPVASVPPTPTIAPTASIPPAPSAASVAPAGSVAPTSIRSAPSTPGTGGPLRAPVPPRRGTWFGVASLVLGVISALLAFVPVANYGAWLIAVGGLVLGVIALTRRDRAKRVAWAGTIASAIGLVLSVVLSIVYTIGFVSAWEGSFATDPSPSATESAAEVVPALFGQTVTYDDGMQIQVGEPETFTPSADARNADGELTLRFAVTIYNGTDADYELFPFTAVTAGAAPGSIVTDAANQMTGVPPVATLAPGESVTAVEGYSFDGSGEVVYTVAPGPEYLPSRFTG